jgi:hypothetical protein
MHGEHGYKDEDYDERGPQAERWEEPELARGRQKKV